jgi:hypothetical protein
MEDSSKNGRLIETCKANLHSKLTDLNSNAFSAAVFSLQVSSIMAYIIIIVVLLVIIGPILALLPSKRQKQQIQMRKAAMAAGVSVALTRIDDPDPDPEAYLSNTGKPLERVMAVVAYRRFRPRPDQWRQRPEIAWALNRQAGAQVKGLPPGWQWHDTQVAGLPPALHAWLVVAVSSLPDDVVRVEEAKFIISVYWRERADAQGVSKLIDFLRDCAALPLTVRRDH